MPGLVTTADVSDLQQAEERLVSELRQRAKQQIEGVSTDGDVHVRDILPPEDLDQDDTNNTNGWNGTDREWVQSGLTADQLEQVYEIDSANNAEGKIVGIFAVSTTATNPITNEIVFEDGTGARFERLMFQEAQTITEGEYALMRNPIIFNQGKDAVIFQETDTDGTAQVVYHGAVAEQAGTTLGTRSQTENAPSGVARQPQRRV